MSEMPLSPNNYIFILGLCLLILFLPYPVWPQAIPIELFQATLTIERIDNVCEEGGISKGILLFGFDRPERIISLLKPSNFCLMASFDPNATIADGRTFAYEHHGGNEEWMVAFLPSQPLRGTWGFRIAYPEPHATGDLRLTWRSKGTYGFPPGRFFLKRGRSNVQGTDMKNTSSADMEDVANNEIMMIEYYHDSCLFDTNIPSKKDGYEPDDDINHAKMYTDQEQIHTFHDPNDTDWIKFWASSEKKYYISLMPVCTPPIDPNIVPFEVSLVINGSPLPLPLLGLRSINFPVYETTWENQAKEGVLAYIKIKINPELEYLGFLPYLFSLEETNLGTYIIYLELKISAKQIKYFYHIYLKSNDRGEKWKPLSCKIDPSDPNSCLFIFEFKTVSNSFSLWLFDKVLDDNFDVRPVTVDLDRYFTNDHNDLTPPPPPIHDLDTDCDGIVGEEDPNPNLLNILFRAGMNLYHHPFHPNNFVTGLQEKIELCTEFRSYLTSFKKISLFINQTVEHRGTWYHYPIESGCNDIFLPNKAGCLIYLSDDLTLSSESNLWGECFSKVIDPNEPMFDPNDPNNLMIGLAPGLNIVGLTYYEAFTFEENKGSEFRTFGDQCVDSFALLRSINSPTTSLEISAPLVDFNLSMNTPESKAYPEQNISSTVLRYDSRSGKWSYCTIFFGHPSGDRFDVGIDEAYLVYFNIQDPNSNQKDPNHTQQDPNYQQDPNRERGKNWYPAIFFWP